MPDAEQHAERLVFVRRGGLGDFVLSLPLLRYCRTRYRHLSLVTKPSYRALFPDDCVPDRLVDCSDAVFSELFASGKTVVSPPLLELFADSRVLWFGKPDPLLEANLRVCGVRSVRWIESRPTIPEHASRQFFRDAGFPTPDGVPDCPLWEARSPSATNLWVHPGSGSSSKNTAPATFAEFAESWLEKHGGGIIVSFGEADDALLEPVAAAFAERNVLFERVVCPSLNALREGLATRAAAFVGNDSGVSHLAGALGVPTTVFFRCTDPRIWRPMGACTVIGSGT